jgi:hypothetical protein
MVCFNSPLTSTAICLTLSFLKELLASDFSPVDSPTASDLLQRTKDHLLASLRDEHNVILAIPRRVI